MNTMLLIASGNSSAMLARIISFPASLLHFMFKIFTETRKNISIKSLVAVKTSKYLY